MKTNSLVCRIFIFLFCTIALFNCGDNSSEYTTSGANGQASDTTDGQASDTSALERMK